MVKKIEKYCRNCIYAFLTISLFILPLSVGAGQTASNTVRDKLRTRISLSCTEEPIETVLMELADKARIDIIKSPEVDCNVTVKISDVPLEEALTNILALYDYTYIATENMVRIIPLPPLTEHKEPQVTRIYRLTYADANEVAAALDEFTSKKAKIGLNKGTSHIMVEDTEDKIKAIDKFIEQIDRKTSQVLVEVRIYDVTSKEGFEIDPKWDIGRNAPYTPGTVRTPKEITETVRGPQSSLYEEFRHDVQWGVPSFGYPDPNFAGSVTDSFGIYDRRETVWTEDPGRTDRETKWIDYGEMTELRRKPFVGGKFDRVTGGALNVSVLNDAIDLNFVLTVLHSQVDARLLANPRILVLDNETANFRIIREIPYREFRQIGREDPIDFTAYKNVGVHLKVTPHIARDGMLRLHIVPDFSVLVNQDLHGVPTVDARRADTKAMIRDGQTVVVGGLRKREVTKDIAKVPVLGDMPLVGGLFTSESESKVINELIVFITTRIITEPAISEREQKLLDETEFTTPQLEKTRIEKGELEVTKLDKTGGGKAGIAESLDSLLKKLGPSRD
jgi:type IV pilus assembly protein PilQ